MSNETKVIEEIVPANSTDFTPEKPKTRLMKAVLGVRDDIHYATFLFQGKAGDENNSRTWSTTKEAGQLEFSGEEMKYKADHSRLVATLGNLKQHLSAAEIERIMEHLGAVDETRYNLAENLDSNK